MELTTCPWCLINLVDVEMYSHISIHDGFPPHLVLSHGRENDDYGPSIVGKLP